VNVLRAGSRFALDSLTAAGWIMIPKSIRTKHPS
jgi:hypothetical protein